METQRRHFFLKDRRGQSTVEYILLIAVVSSFAFAVLNNPRIKNMFGEDSTLMAMISKRFEYSFRFAVPGDQVPNVNYSSPNHPSYLNIDTNKSRFFIPLESYGPQP